jgi:cell division transport system permease protein
MEADLAKVADLAQRAAGIRSAAIVPKAESDRMLEPWLGSGLDLADLPIPRLVTLTFEDGARPDLAELRRHLSGEVPGATLDDHQAWLSRLSLMANAIVVIGIGLTVIVLVAAALAVAFATQGAVAANREVVEVLHYVGANDGFIAWEFQRRFFALGLKGSAIGAGLALLALAALSFASASWRASPAGDQIEAMFGSFAIGWRAYAGACVLAFLVSLITALVSRFMVKRFLRRSP